MSTIFWCHGCGFESTQTLGSCPTCSAALQSSTVAWLDGDIHADETVYELELTSLQRAGLVEALIEDEVSHRWDSVDELVVLTSEEDAVDVIIDDVLHEEVEVVEDGDGAREEGGEDGYGSDDGYQAMSQLFLAADRLLKKWDDDDAMGAYIDQASSVLFLEAPVGMDEEEWAGIQSLARNSSAILGQGAPAPAEDSADGDQQQVEAPESAEARVQVEALRNALKTLV